MNGTRIINIGDKVDVVVKTTYGNIIVTFLIIDVLAGQTYLAYAQKRIAVLLYTANGEWNMIQDKYLIGFLNEQ